MDLDDFGLNAPTGPSPANSPAPRDFGKRSFEFEDGPTRKRACQRPERILEDSSNHCTDLTPCSSSNSSVLPSPGFLVPVPPACHSDGGSPAYHSDGGSLSDGGGVVRRSMPNTDIQLKTEPVDTDLDLPLLPPPGGMLGPAPHRDANLLPPLTCPPPPSAGGGVIAPGGGLVQPNPVDVKAPWLSKDLEITFRLMSGHATPHMVQVGVGGKDEIACNTDRRTQTANRIRRLDMLTRRARSSKVGLSLTEEGEKRRLLKLEKNRRAAQISREKKKRYILNLEDRASAMGRQLAALELENNQLRALLLELQKNHRPRA